jgi:hypothetical protein
MHTICWSPKGGSGTTVVAATIALASPRPTLLIDLAGDLPACLGTAEPAPGRDRWRGGPDGILDWLRSDAGPDRLDDLAQTVDDGLVLIRRGHRDVDGPPIRAERWQALADHIVGRTGDTVIDLGTLDDGRHQTGPLWRTVDRRLMVIRQCYLALRTATRSPALLRGDGDTPGTDGAILVTEADRALGVADIQRCIDVPIVAVAPLDKNVSRAVDAGLMLTRRPQALLHVAALAR